jgi:hypothetical protein
MSGWDCRCGVRNKPFTDQCANCGGFRITTDVESAPRLTSDPLADQSTCQVCGRRPAAYFTFTRNQGMLFVRRRFSHQGRYCKSCATGAYRAVQARNLTEGWYGTISFFTTIAYGFENLANLRRGRAQLGDPTPSDPQMENRLNGRPTIVRMVTRPMGVVMLAVLAVVVALLVTQIPAQTAKSADKAYVDSLVSINASRNTMISVANAKNAAWQKKTSSQTLTADDLVATELATFKASVAAMPAPRSTDLVGLNQTWNIRLAALAAAETNLGAAYTSQTVTADQKAWADEETAYTALIDYVKAHY